MSDMIGQPLDFPIPNVLNIRIRVNVLALAPPVRCIFSVSNLKLLAATDSSYSLGPHHYCHKSPVSNSICTVPVEKIRYLFSAERSFVFQHRSFSKIIVNDTVQ